MNKKQRKILVKDICGRLPFGPYVEDKKTKMMSKIHNVIIYQKYKGNDIDDYLFDIDVFDGHPLPLKEFNLLLRPMDDMTEKEQEEYRLCCAMSGYDMNGDDADRVSTFLNSHMLDYRGLIEQKIAKKAPKDLYYYGKDSH